MIVKRNNVIIYSECKKDFAFAINDDLRNSTNVLYYEYVVVSILFWISSQFSFVTLYESKSEENNYDHSAKNIYDNARKRDHSE